jgi:IS30 family transposase
MSEKMSKQVRKEILLYTRKRYKYSLWKDKRKVLDEFVAITGYQRKYAIYLLGSKAKRGFVDDKIKVPSKKKYNDEVKKCLLQIWMFANQICSKRLVPFIPILLESLERFGHLNPSSEVRNLLLTISPATADRLLRGERRKSDKKGMGTTCAGNLLKKQIKVRTFTDWNDVVPGFMEGDLVAHCGNTVAGGFLSTLVLTDIASSWTEFIPLLNKKDATVIEALRKVKQLIPFPLLGLDTDNGSEFINFKLVGFCKKHKITFTRSRAYKKNDQAHVKRRMDLLFVGSLVMIVTKG